MDRFGRFPQRNKVLGRENTPEEEEWLNNLPVKFKWWSILGVLLNCPPVLVIHLEKCPDQLEISMFDWSFGSHSLPPFQLGQNWRVNVRYSVYGTSFFLSHVSHHVNNDKLSVTFFLLVTQSFPHEERLRDGRGTKSRLRTWNLRAGELNFESSKFERG